MGAKTDLRFVKTEESLKKGFIEILKSNNGKPVKLIDLCKKCFINKATFYRHYETLPIFQNHLQYQTIKNIVSPAFKNNNFLLNIESEFRNVINNIQKNKDLIDILFTNYPYNTRSAMFGKVILDLVKSSNANPDQILKISFCVGGCAAIITDNLNDDSVEKAICFVKKVLN